MDLVAYTGTIKFQAADNYQSPWYNVSESYTYLNKTGTIHHNVIGYYPLLRVAFNNSVYTTGLNGQIGNPAQINAVVSDLGVVVGAEVVIGGNGYLAPPLLEFFGDGAGAQAEAQVDANGTVTGVTILSGGSGYRPIPPTNRQVTITVSCGRAENILYR